ncbi:MAG: hypothetical protein JWN43_1196, partial [Gammaproteobacteria bacterium]|nr:hypothetical protein [Gammaproteobacteria bacterium]
MPRFGDLRSFVKAAGSLGTRPISVGISGRLIFSFTAVAILAATANLILEHGVAVIRTKHVDRGSISPSPPVPPQRTIAPAPIATAPPPADPTTANPEILFAAIERYQRAVDVRASFDSTATRAEAEAAAKYLVGVSKPGTAAAKRATAYETLGRTYIQIADA